MDEAKTIKSERNRRKKEAAKRKKQGKAEEKRVLKEAIELSEMEKEEIVAQNKIAELEGM